MDMTNVERVVKTIEEIGFTITHYPCRASIKIEEVGFKSFMGNVIEFERVCPIGLNKYTLFISDEEDHNQFHNGLYLLGNTNMAKVLWFKEPYDKITRYEGLYI